MNLIFTMSAGLQSGYESCQLPANPNPSQLSLIWTYPPRAQNLWGVQTQKKAHAPFFLHFYICLRELHMLSSPRPHWSHVTYSYLCLFFALPSQLSWGESKGWIKESFFHNSVKIKSIYRLFRKFASRFLS